MRLTIAVAGLGYVGLSNAILLARQHRVVALDIDPGRVATVNAGRTPIHDADCAAYLAAGGLDLSATTDAAEAYGEADLVIVATPTNYDPSTHAFDTRAVEAAIAAAMAANDRATIVIKSTVPVGFTAALSARLGTDRILFSPEFLREGRALADNLRPSRIVVGDTGSRGARVAEMFRRGALNPDVPVLLTGPTEAEAIKLFSNTYLALRVALFNEIDTLAMTRDLDPRELIEGICLDPRIGQGYNNPSFGFGGYCLPKDSKQLLASFGTVPQALIGAIVAGNEARKAAIADAVIARRPRRVGVYRLVMKQGSDNFRESAVQDVMARLAAAGLDLIVYEPMLGDRPVPGARVEPDFARFCAEADLILANRRAPELAAVADKLFTRDQFGTD